MFESDSRKRPLNRNLLLGGFVLAALLALGLPWMPRRRPRSEDPPAPPPERFIRFPSDRSLGDLRFRKWDSRNFTEIDAYFDTKVPAIIVWGWDRSAYSMGDSQVTRAQGVVVVPAARQVLLHISDPAAIPLLDHLEPDNLQAICFTNVWNTTPLEVDADGISHLGRLTGLRHLILAFTKDPTLETYQAIAGLQSLRSIGFNTQPPDPARFHELTKLRNLETLELHFPPTDSILSQLKDFPSLRNLSVERHPNGEWRSSPPMEPLAHLEDLTGLETFAFNSPGFQNGDLRRLRNMKRLERLFLNNGQIDDDGLQFLSGMTEMKVLNLGSMNLQGRGLKVLEGMKKLRVLNLRGNKISGESLAPLAGLKSLDILSLDSNPIEDEGLEYLHGLKSLEHLSLNGTNITQRGSLRLQRSLPNCVVRSPFSSSAPAPPLSDQPPLS